MNKSITFNQSEQLARDLDSITARLVEIAADKTLSYPRARAETLCELALIHVWSHETRPVAREALNRLMNALEKITS